METSLKIISGKDITNQHTLTQSLIDIDYKCFGDIETEDEGTVDKWDAIEDACFAHVIFDNDTPVGYIDFVSLRPNGIERLLKGELRDGEVPNYANTTPSPSLSLYITAIAILPEYRGRGLSKILWNKSRDYFISNKYYIEELYSNIWTNEGQTFFNHFKTELKNKDGENHHIIKIKLENHQLPLYNI